MTSGFSFSYSDSSSIFRRTVTRTLLTKGGTFLISLSASVNDRFLGEEDTPTTNPTASAPASEAAYKSSFRVIPQIFTLTPVIKLIQTP